MFCGGHAEETAYAAGLAGGQGPPSWRNWRNREEINPWHENRVRLGLEAWVAFVCFCRLSCPGARANAVSNLEYIYSLWLFFFTI